MMGEAAERMRRGGGTEAGSPRLRRKTRASPFLHLFGAGGGDGGGDGKEGGVVDALGAQPTAAKNKTQI